MKKSKKQFFVIFDPKGKKNTLYHNQICNLQYVLLDLTIEAAVFMPLQHLSIVSCSINLNNYVVASKDKTNLNNSSFSLNSSCHFILTSSSSISLITFSASFLIYSAGLDKNISAAKSFFSFCTLLSTRYFGTSFPSEASLLPEASAIFLTSNFYTLSKDIVSIFSSMLKDISASLSLIELYLSMIIKSSCMDLYVILYSSFFFNLAINNTSYLATIIHIIPMTKFSQFYEKTK